jgi:hypothetical protein
VLGNHGPGNLESIGISLISEWGMLAFVYRHGPSLTSTEQIAKLIGYENGAVGAPRLNARTGRSSSNVSGCLGKYVFTEC